MIEDLTLEISRQILQGDHIILEINPNKYILDSEEVAML